jgi:HemK-related putative methylase
LGHTLRTDPGVFDPIYFSSSRILAEDLLERPLQGVRLLDMGTGAGPVAVVAGAAGARVTACDINPRAVSLARENLALNRLHGEVIESDLFAALAGRRFDLICFNMPFYPRDPANYFQAAYNAGRDLETVHRFADGCGKHLEADGRVVVLFSEDSDYERVLHAFTAKGFSVESERATRRLLEDFHVAWFKRENAGKVAPFGNER